MSDQPILALTLEEAVLDSLGALVAVSVLHPEAELLVPSKVPLQARRLWSEYAARQVNLQPPIELVAAVKRAAGGQLMVVGTADAARIGTVAQHLEDFSSVLAIATHPSEGDELPRLPLPQAVSCAAAMACRIAERHLVPSAVQAGLMLMGIQDATGHFSVPGTTAIDHQGAAHCVAWGAGMAGVGHAGVGHVGAGPDRSPRAEELMVRPFVAASADASVDSVAELLHRHRINALPLFEEPTGEGLGARRRWVGQVSRQEVDAAVRHGLGSAPARQISARPPGWVRPRLPLSQLREVLLRGHGRMWLVGTVDEDEEAHEPGLLTRTTVLRAAAEPTMEGSRLSSAPDGLHARLSRALGPRWSPVRSLGELAAELGQTAWLVGGGVRDLLLQRAVRDADVVVEGDAARLARAAARRWGGACQVHDAFRTAKWIPPGWSEDDEPIDVASARAEHYPGRAKLPIVMPAELRQDLHRRDFSINAMAVCLQPGRIGELRDPYGGWMDLQADVLRVLHGLSFHDDPTRAIRAARFAARFGLQLAPGTRGLLDGAVESGVFDELGATRLGAELDRLLDEEDPTTALGKLKAWGLVSVLHAAWRIDNGLLDELAAVMLVWREERDETDGLQTSGQERPSRADCGWVVIAGGLSVGKRAEVAAMVPGNKLRRQRFVAGPEVVRKAIDGVAAARRRTEVAQALRGLDAVQWLVCLGLARSLPDSGRLELELRWWWQQGRHIRSAVDGRWLQQRGHRPGPSFSKALARAREVAWDGGDAASQGAAALEVLAQLTR